uniref:Ig-like domain-containing protein n=1 Tax=Erpetoichthys calabaricus TaxID=27687 RepID=A0A8C4SN69_ERPCA
GKSGHLCSSCYPRDPTSDNSFVPFPDVSLADVFMQPHRSVRAQLGGSVHLECHMKVSSQYSYIWIKHTQGELPETIVFWSYHEGRTHKANDGSTRYQVMTSLSSFNLSITHLDTSDLGTYYCGVVKPYDILFRNGTEVCLTGKETIRGIFQPPVLKPVQYGDDVTLECIINRRVFGNAHQVFWIHRTIGGSYQTIRSTHENQRKCAGESQECVHSLQKKNFSFQDAGTYYCALVSCGEIILGNGTECTGKLTDNHKYHHHYILLVVKIRASLGLINHIYYNLHAV